MATTKYTSTGHAVSSVVGQPFAGVAQPVNLNSPNVSVSDGAGVDWSLLGDKLIAGFGDALDAWSTSAIKAEKESTAAANATQEKWMQDQREFNAEQAQLDRDFQQTSADKQMAFQREERIAAQDWSKMMSDTSYQRAIEDLRAAGLNPALAFQQGGASAPTSSGSSGASASGASASSSVSSAQKANISSAKQADVALLRNFLSATASIFGTTISSATKVLKWLL